VDQDNSNEWRSFWADVEAVRRAVANSKAKNINAAHLRESARDLCQRWFRETRVDLVAHGMPEAAIAGADQAFQQLLRLTTGNNVRTSYTRVLKALAREYKELETLRTVTPVGAGANSSRRVDSTEGAILFTLRSLVPSAAISYEQVIADLDGPPRLSYRGTATELREAVREVLDHMAPDAEVMATPGFKLEKDQRSPTMKQKARFILRARGVGESASKAPEDAVQLLEDQIASLARSVYVRGAVSTHSVTSRDQTVSFKRYADAVLAELLQTQR
jgi:hypothetical protein